MAVADSAGITRFTTEETKDTKNHRGVPVAVFAVI